MVESNGIRGAKRWRRWNETRRQMRRAEINRNWQQIELVVVFLLAMIVSPNSLPRVHVWYRGGSRSRGAAAFSAHMHMAGQNENKQMIGITSLCCMFSLT